MSKTKISLEICMRHLGKPSLISSSIQFILLACVGTTTITYAENGNDLPTLKLDTLVVTASSGGITPTVNQQVVEKSTILDMKDVLEDQPSISVASGNGLAQQLYIRNLGENELEFTVDGVPTKSAVFHHQSRFMFDPALLKKLEVQKGTGSASSGIGVTGGAIRMTTVDASDMLKKGKKIGGMVGAGYSSNQGWSATAAGYGRGELDNGGSVDAIVMINQIAQEDYQDGDNVKIPNTAVIQRAVMGKLGWNVDKDNRLVISHRREQNMGDFGLRSNLIGTFRKQTIMDTDIIQDTTTFHYNGQNIANSGAEIDATAYFGKVTDERKQVKNASPRFANIDSSIKKHGLDAKIIYPISNHDLVTGVNYRNNTAKAEAKTKGNGATEDKKEIGAFAEMQWDFDNILLTTGVRYDNYEVENTKGKTHSDNLISPSISAIWSITDEFSVNASWAQAIQSPIIEESLLVALGRSANYANDLKAGKAQTAEIGFEWTSNMGIALGASVYQQRIKDYIHTVYKDKVALQTNDGELESNGFEVNAGFRNDSVKAYVGMSHSEPELNGKYYGNSLEVAPTGTKYNASLSYMFDEPKLEVGAKARYVSEYTFRKPADEEDTVLPEYFVTDLFASWQLLGDDTLSINAGINNLTDKKYYSQTNFRTPSFPPPNKYEAWNPEKGREYRLGLNYKF